MIKFLKTKRGFTLVELMIVVVIMAILVAVAVPIYSAVTANAKKKTCVANQREIVAQITNTAMSSYDLFNYQSGTIVITTDSAGEGYSSIDMNSVCTEELFAGLFQVMPFCPIAENKIFISVEKGKNDGEIYVKTHCEDKSGTVTDHEYNPDDAT